jgi:signal transduction histidine kinase
VRAEARPGDRVRLWVEDNGIGIAAAHSARIFEVFQRLHGTEEFPGTGIGLAIVRRGVERLGGTVGLESAPGQGSRFWIELPCAPEEEG